MYTSNDSQNASKVNKLLILKTCKIYNFKDSRNTSKDKKSLVLGNFQTYTPVKKMYSTKRKSVRKNSSFLTKWKN